MDYTKNLIDELNAVYNKNKYTAGISPITNFTKTAYSITYYDSVVVFEKRLRPEQYLKIAAQAIIGKKAF